MARDPREPCAQCPFRRDVRPDICELKDSHPAEFIGQVFGPFLLPCHLDAGFVADARDPGNVQCPGAATFRTNVGVWARVELPAALLRLPGDTDRYFATLEEFLAHHLRCSPEAAERWLRSYPPERLLDIELRKRGVRVTVLGPAGGAS